MLQETLAELGVSLSLSAAMKVADSYDEDGDGLIDFGPSVAQNTTNSSTVFKLP